MPKTEQFIEEISRENGYGVLLMAQMDSVPETLQFVIATTEYDDEAKGLRDNSRYIVRAVGVQEHRVSMGIFGHIQFPESHPLLYQYNEQPMGLFFRGTPDHPQELLLDLIQAYSSVMQEWRHIPTYLNMQQPLADLVRSGGGLLGEMPGSLADGLERALQHHGLETHRVAGEKSDGPPMKLMLLDDSVVVAMDFTIEELGKVE
jgi:hypothetical protein